MPITTRLQTRYAIQKILVIIVCVVFGLWGVYDYEVKIPAKERAVQRRDICQRVKEALEAEPGSPDARTKTAEASEAVQGEIAKLFAGTLTASNVGPKEAEEAIASIRARNEEAWLKVLLLFTASLQEADRRTSISGPSDLLTTAGLVARRGINETAEITRPGAWDRTAQWLFILCLPYVPFALWGYLRAKRRVHRLDEDGTLHAPEGTFAPEEIADIDMSRWMSKSIAAVVLRDGRRVKLDDYVHRNVNLIAGALASARYPEQWHADGRPKRDEPAGGEGGPDAGQGDEADDESGAEGERTPRPEHVADA